MVHPAPVELDRMPCLAVSHFDARYTGKEAHASAYPERGVNAADAITIAQVAIGLLRQHAGRGDQVHGIVTYGGAAPNIVPAPRRGEVLCARRDPAGTGGLGAEGREVLRGGRARHRRHRSRSCPRAPRTRSSAPTRRWRRSTAPTPRHWAVSLPEHEEAALSASTDMGNVSLAIPSIHPLLGDRLAPGGQPPGRSSPPPPLGPAADRAVLDGAMAMAWTAIDIASDEAPPAPRRHRLPAPLRRRSRAGGQRFGRYSPKTSRSTSDTSPSVARRFRASRIGTSRFWVPRAAARTSSSAASDAGVVPRRPQGPQPLDLALLQGWVDGEDLGLAGRPLRRTC